MSRLKRPGAEGERHRFIEYGSECRKGRWKGLYWDSPENYSAGITSATYLANSLLNETSVR